MTHYDLPRIEREVAEVFGVSVPTMRSGRRNRSIARARQAAMYLATETTPLSFARIGRYFLRDHTTVLHAWKRVAELRSVDPAFDAKVAEVEGRLGAARGPDSNAFVEDADAGRIGRGLLRRLEKALERDAPETLRTIAVALDVMEERHGAH